LGVGGISPRPVAIFLLRGDGGSDGEFERGTNRSRALGVTRREITIVDRAVGFGEGQHGKAVMVHAVAEKAGVGILLANNRLDSLANVHRVDAEVGVLAGGEERHDAKSRLPGPRLAFRPASII